MNYDPNRPLTIHFDFEPERPRVVAWPFPLINGVRMSHDEYHVEDPTAKCGMACVWYDEEKRQGLA